ncbi:hypothetical protein EPN15_05740 [Patescibacteria group bacterium]|nr:MAG: hypothetical protein EPN15_05740 [Patescibacteria group bacterium]
MLMDQYPFSKKEFENLVRREAAARKVSFVRALYMVSDGLTERWRKEHREIKPICQKGCSFCCHQIATCTAIEWEEIVPFVMRQKKLFRKRLHKMRGKWLWYLERNQNRLVSDPEKLLDDWRGTPCIFLGGDGGCLIYDVRPLQCRTLDSSKACVSWHQPEVRKYHFLWEGFAYILLEEEQERLGREGEGGSLINLASRMESSQCVSRYIPGRPLP